MTKIPKIEIHAVIVFEDDVSATILVNSHTFWPHPKFPAELARELCAEFAAVVDVLARDQINNHEKGGYDGTPQGA